MPVLIGWSCGHQHASTGPRSSCSPIIFYWTPPHFWALAIRYRDDYAAADVPMLPSVVSLQRTAEPHPGLHAAARGPSRSLFSPVAGMGHLYLGSAVVLGAVFTWFALRLSQLPDPALSLGAVGRRHRGRGPGHRDAPLHLVDHLHHAALRRHGRRPAAAVRMVIAPWARRFRRAIGPRD